MVKISEEEFRMTYMVKKSITIKGISTLCMFRHRKFIPVCIQVMQNLSPIMQLLIAEIIRFQLRRRGCVFYVSVTINNLYHYMMCVSL